MSVSSTCSLFLITYFTEYQCNKEGSIYGFEYDLQTNICACKPGWVGQKCDGKIYSNKQSNSLCASKT